MEHDNEFEKTFFLSLTYNSEPCLQIPLRLSAFAELYSTKLIVELNISEHSRDKKKTQSINFMVNKQIFNMKYFIINDINIHMAHT